jgi:predicted secreted protein
MRTHVVTEPGERVVVQPGDLVEVRVDENASTGYQWEIASKPTGVDLVSSSVESASSPGASAVRVLGFRVSAETEGVLKLELRRPWQTGATPEATFQVQIAADRHQR